MTRRPCAAGASSRPTWWAPRATCRWRTAAWAASCSGAPPRPATSSPWSTWVAREPSRKTRAPPRPPCAASGRPIAATWATDIMGGLAGGLLPRVWQLNAEYARALDDDRLEDWPDFFAEDC